MLNIQKTYTDKEGNIKEYKTGKIQLSKKDLVEITPDEIKLLKHKLILQSDIWNSEIKYKDKKDGSDKILKKFGCYAKLDDNDTSLCFEWFEYEQKEFIKKKVEKFDEIIIYSKMIETKTGLKTIFCIDNLTAK